MVYPRSSILLTLLQCTVSDSGHPEKQKASKNKRPNIRSLISAGFSLQRVYQNRTGQLQRFSFTWISELTILYVFYNSFVKQNRIPGQIEQKTPRICWRLNSNVGFSITADGQSSQAFKSRYKSTILRIHPWQFINENDFLFLIRFFNYSFNALKASFHESSLFFPLYPASFNDSANLLSCATFLVPGSIWLLLIPVCWNVNLCSKDSLTR